MSITPETVFCRIELSVYHIIATQDHLFKPFIQTIYYLFLRH